MDVESLYTNIPHDDGITACSWYLQNHNLPADPIAKIIHFILTHNYFSFDQELYLQQMGVAMGSRFAPQYANLFMAKLEEDFLSQCPTKPMAYFRYIDDILIIWSAGAEDLINFHRNYNSFHPTIRLKLTYSSTEINFLDTKISIKGQNLETSVYRKPTDRPTYLRHDSFHPKHVKSSIIFSQGIRYNRICSNTMDRDTHLDSLKMDFIKQGYKPSTTDAQIQKALRIPRENLLQYKDSERKNRVPLVVTYNPHLEVLRKIGRELQPLLHRDQRLQEIFPDPPLLAYRQPKNLRQLIVRSSLSGPAQYGTSPCMQKRCVTCKHIHTTDTIRIPGTQQDYKVQGTFSCKSANLVYLIMCVRCPTSIYIGQTGQTLRKRINMHRFTIRNKKTDVPVAEHFCSAGHSLTDLRVTVLMGDFKSQKERLQEECKFIRKFNSLHSGLNRDNNFMCHYDLD